MSKGELLYEKLESEYEDFIAVLGAKPQAVIIESSYEKVIKQDLLELMSSAIDNLPDTLIDRLLDADMPLNMLYQDWLKSDYSYMDALRMSIDDTIDRLEKSTMTNNMSLQKESDI